MTEIYHWYIIVTHTLFQENINASLMPRRWTLPNFDDSQWRPASARQFAVEPYAKTSLALNLTNGVRPVKWQQTSPGKYFADFGSEMMGGLRLQVNAPAGTQLQVTLLIQLRCDWRRGPAAVVVASYC